jgi:hypothetical protein
MPKQTTEATINEAADRYRSWGRWGGGDDGAGSNGG